MMRTSDFDYHLPEELIAQHPLERRDASRLLSLRRDSADRDQIITHHTFSDLPRLLRPDDVLVFNESRVIPARLFGRKSPSGGRAEILLVRELAADTWQAMTRPGLKVGQRIAFSDSLWAEITETLPDGLRQVRFDLAGLPLREALWRLGQMPTPPYIHEKLADPERYQTVYSRVEGSVAAPTAGLHFTQELLAELSRMGVGLEYVTLHVGLGTFSPVQVEDFHGHKMHSEYCEVSAEVADRLNEAKARGRRIVAVGTTAVRALESASTEEGKVQPFAAETKIFIYPGYRFRAVGGMITNFHLPRSTLMMLVSAFAGRERMLRAYEVAIGERYRFFSFGDAMLIL